MSVPHSQRNGKPTAVGKYIDLYREHCATTPTLNNQECAVIERLAEWAQAQVSETRQTRNDVLEEAAKVALAQRNPRLTVPHGRAEFDVANVMAEKIASAIRLSKNADQMIVERWQDSLKDAASPRPTEPRNQASAESASPCVVVPTGWALVPLEPTQHMYSAFSTTWLNTQRKKPPIKFAAGWQAALAAAPTPKGDADV